jgi:hypothetical protein
MLCYRCGGTGRYLGNGMMMTDCTLCDDTGNLIKESQPKIDRHSSSYKKAIKEIMALNPSITKDEAVKMFDKAYNKV